ncbi:hypothetical protein PQX77_000386 [Marasmius sp. AFHP31]|nr:hypothetical protein PQX77_000386 [Marasmius sp. AFHP31]
MACIAQTVALVKKNVKAVSYAQNIQLSISVMVCNFLVVITTLFRLIFRRKGSSDDSEEEEREVPVNTGEYAVGTTRHAHACTTTTTPGLNSTGLASAETQLTELDGIQIETFSLGSIPDSWVGGGSREGVETPVRTQRSAV